MKTILGAVTAVAVLFAGEAQAQEAAQKARSGVHTHDGFFLQMDLAPGWMTTSAEDRGVEWKLSGGGAQFGIGIGGALTPNFILAGQLWGPSIFEPDVELNGAELDSDDDASVSLAGIGVQLVYYFMPSNIYVSATPSITRLTFDNGSSDYESEAGFGVKLAVGKEWWVSDNWALGLNGQFAYSRNDDDDSNDATWNSYWFGVAFSATFN